PSATPTSSASPSTASSAKTRRASPEALLEHDEVEIVATRKTEPLVAIGKGLRRTGARVAAPLIPRDQLRTLRDHGHLHGGRAELVTRVDLRRREQLRADAAALLCRPRARSARRVSQRRRATSVAQ